MPINPVCGEKIFDPYKASGSKSYDLCSRDELTDKLFLIFSHENLHCHVPYYTVHSNEWESLIQINFLHNIVPFLAGF
jgi:hypothetical protein